MSAEQRRLDAAQAHRNEHEDDSDDENEEEVGCCMRYCIMCGWIKQACGELGRLFCWPPVPSRIASKLAFVPPAPHYGTHAYARARTPSGSSAALHGKLPLCVC